ncbi:hypothetical protein BG004_002182 [Podila humilis]|nr:hypothetical protein BG004_002182 [Podila humilis]
MTLSDKTLYYFCSLRELDIRNMDVTAQTLMDIAMISPFLEILKLTMNLDIGGVAMGCLAFSLEHYQSRHDNSNNSNHSNDDNKANANISEKYTTFARDLALACPRLHDLTLRNSTCSIRVKEYDPEVQLAKSMIYALGSRLDVLSIWKNIVFDSTMEALLLMGTVHGQVMPLNTAVSTPTTATTTSSTATTTNSRAGLRELHVPGASYLTDENISSETIVSFLERAAALKVFSGQLLCLDLEDLMLAPGGSVPLRPWGCLELEHLSMGIKEPFYSDYSDFRPIRLSLTRTLFCHLSLLRCLRVLRLIGRFTFPCDLLASGFHQLRALSSLEEIAVNFEWNGLGWRMIQAPSMVSEEDGLVLHTSKKVTMIMPIQRKEFLDREDLEWMVRHWPKIRSMSFGVWAVCRTRVANEMKQWLKDLGKVNVAVLTHFVDQEGRQTNEFARL